jgi:hypothetical protein
LQDSRTVAADIATDIAGTHYGKNAGALPCYKNLVMARVRFSLLLIALALLLPLAAGAESCDTCLSGDSADCCPPTCALCVCCGQSVPELSGSPTVDRYAETTAFVAGPAEVGCRSADPRDVFHVPKPA